MLSLYQLFFFLTISDPFIYTDNTNQIISSVNPGYSIYEIPDNVISFENGAENSYPFIGVRDESFEVRFTENSQLEIISEYCFYRCSKMTSINLEVCHKLKQICNWAFRGNGIKSLILPESLQQITGWHAFADSKLESITIKSKNCSLGAGTFWNSKLTTFAIKSEFNVFDGEVFGLTPIKEFKLEGDHSKISVWQGSVYSKSFSNLICHRRVCEKYEIHPYCNQIDYLAFCGCNCSILTIPSHVNKFSSCAFFAFYGIEIQLPSNLETIPKRLFEGSTNLQIITIPEGVKKIEKGAFSGCSKVRQLRLPHSLQEIGSDVFAGFKVKCVIDCPQQLVEVVFKQLPGARHCFVDGSLNCGSSRKGAKTPVYGLLIIQFLDLFN